MIKCPKCATLMDSQYDFCGECGAYMKPNCKLVIDGKKNNKLKRFLNKNLSSKKRTILFFIIWLLILPISIWLIYDGVKNLMELSSKLPDILSQIGFKSKYIKEGLSLSYIAKEINFLLDYLIEWVYFISGSILSLSSLFYLGYFGYNISLRIKLKEQYYYKKSLTLNKICVAVSKTVFILCIILILLIIILSIIKYIIGVL